MNNYKKLYFSLILYMGWFVLIAQGSPLPQRYLSKVSSDTIIIMDNGQEITKALSDITLGQSGNNYVYPDRGVVTFGSSTLLIFQTTTNLTYRAGVINGLLEKSIPYATIASGCEDFWNNRSSNETPINTIISTETINIVTDYNKDNSLKVFQINLTKALNKQNPGTVGAWESVTAQEVASGTEIIASWTALGRP